MKVEYIAAWVGVLVFIGGGVWAVFKYDESIRARIDALETKLEATPLNKPPKVENSSTFDDLEARISTLESGDANGGEGVKLSGAIVFFDNDTKCPSISEETADLLLVVRKRDTYTYLFDETAGLALTDSTHGHKSGDAWDSFRFRGCHFK